VVSPASRVNVATSIANPAETSRLGNANRGTASAQRTSVIRAKTAGNPSTAAHSPMVLLCPTLPAVAPERCATAHARSAAMMLA